MSFQPRTRLQKILMGIAATPRTALEHAVKYAVDNAGGGGGEKPVHVPFEVTIGEGGALVGTTTASFADVKADVAAKKDVCAEVSIPGGSVAVAPLVAYNPATAPTVLVFATQFKNSGDTDKPTSYQIGFSANAVSVDAIELT